MSEATAYRAQEADVDALQRLCYADAEFARRYEGWEPIGHGASATVVRVRLMGHPLALKIFTNLSDDGRARLRAEFASTVQLTSPYVIRTYSVFDRGAIAWLEMEAIDGPNLQHELDRRQREGTPFSRAERLDIGIAAAAALVEAHKQGLVHRDIKPANILLPRRGDPVAKLGDFGVARVAGVASLTATGAFAGTPRWAAPEAFAGKVLGPSADVYSLCLCLFALFTGNAYPWFCDGEASLETYLAWHTRLAPTLSQPLSESGLGEVTGLVSTGLDKRPGKRPSAVDVLGALQTLRSTAPLTTASARPFARRRLSATVAWSLLGLSVTAALVLTQIGPRPGGAARQSASGLESAPGGRLPVRGRDPGSTGLPAGSRPGLGAKAKLAGDFVVIENGTEALRGPELEIVTALGTRHRMTLPQSLMAHETMLIARDMLRPPIAARYAGELHVRAETPRSTESDQHAPTAN